MSTPTVTHTDNEMTYEDLMAMAGQGPPGRGGGARYTGEELLEWVDAQIAAGQ